MFNCGMMAVELSGQTLEHIFRVFSGKETFIETDLEKYIFILKADGLEEEAGFSISGFDRSLVASGGWVEYADAKY